MRRFLIVLSVAVLAGCASSPAVKPPTATYKIPVIKENSRVEVFTVEPDPDETERMLFCIEDVTVILCVAEEGGVARRYFFPIVRPEPRPEQGAGP